jgi:ribonuclease P protein component
VKSIYRLKKDADFKVLISKKNITRSPIFTLYTGANTLDHTRVGISVSKKVGNAVVRNKIRRQMKAILFKQLNFEEKRDLLFIIKSDYLLHSYQSVEQEVVKHFIKIRRPIH